jgi:hypothetical protein
MKYVLILFLLSDFSGRAYLSEDGWEILAKVKFTEKFHKEENEYYLYPFFDSKIRAYEGKDFTLKGHYLPMDLDNSHTIILSKFPYSMCFFCGGASPASVVEVYFKAKPPKFKADQIITIKGILKLNDRDIEHMNFILKDAELIK